MDAQYTRRLEKIEEILARWLPENPGSSWVRRAAGPVETVPSGESLNSLIDPGRDLLNRGGKRWRPMLALLIAELFGEGPLAAELAPLVEFAHTGSLIIDDIEDNADMRRGRKTVHLLYGTDTAINAGNFLYFLSPSAIDFIEAPDSLRLRLYRTYTLNMRRLHFGQGMDIYWHRNPKIFPPLTEYYRMCSFKTGSLARFSGQVGMITAGVSEEDPTFEVLSGACGTLGVGFQIIDDVINLSTGNPGKARGDDIVEGKKSLPVLLHTTEHPEDIELITDIFRRAAEGSGVTRNRAVEEGISLLEASGSIAAARKRALQMLGEAEVSFQTVFPGGTGRSSEARECLLSMISAFKRSG
jgi:geranylgeranyl pyrophosphate synthase